MAGLSATLRSELESRFGGRVSFRRAERKLYGHDIGAMPSLIKPLIGNTTPAAVVQPETEEELVDLVRWAAEHNVPITPRAKASSGYGGVIPVKRGLVVDFYRLNRVLQIDPEAQMARVQAGVVAGVHQPTHGGAEEPRAIDGAQRPPGGGAGAAARLLRHHHRLPKARLRGGESEAPRASKTVAAGIGKVRLDEALEAGAEKVLALCPCCEFQLRVSADKKQVPIEVVDLARFASSALGYQFPDPNPEVRKQWAVFEAMIALMTPQGFAGLMGTMWPELIDAMPFGMGPMMRVLGRIPGALELMRPMFPVLFPRLLPMMMPKVMQVMLERVADLVPVPDYMREQMPEMMPKVMANLMPHMIGDVVPLVTQPMIDYLRGKRMP